MKFEKLINTILLELQDDCHRFNRLNLKRGTVEGAREGEEYTRLATVCTVRGFRNSTVRFLITLEQWTDERNGIRVPIPMEDTVTILKRFVRDIAYGCTPAHASKITGQRPAIAKMVQAVADLIEKETNMSSWDEQRLIFFAHRVKHEKYAGFVINHDGVTFVIRIKEDY